MQMLQLATSWYRIGNSQFVHIQNIVFASEHYQKKFLSNKYNDSITKGNISMITSRQFQFKCIIMTQFQQKHPGTFDKKTADAFRKFDKTLLDYIVHKRARTEHKSVCF